MHVKYIRGKCAWKPFRRPNQIPRKDILVFAIPSLFCRVIRKPRALSSLCLLSLSRQNTLRITNIVIDSKIVEENFIFRDLNLKFLEKYWNTVFYCVVASETVISESVISFVWLLFYFWKLRRKDGREIWLKNRGSKFVAFFVFFFYRSQYFSRESGSRRAEHIPFPPPTPQESVAAPLHAGVKMAAASRLHPG